MLGWEKISNMGLFLPLEVPFEYKWNDWFSWVSLAFFFDVAPNLSIFVEWAKQILTVPSHCYWGQAVPLLFSPSRSSLVKCYLLAVVVINCFSPPIFHEMLTRFYFDLIWFHFIYSRKHKSPVYEFGVLSILLSLHWKPRETAFFHPNDLLHSSLQRRPSWAMMAACTWRSSCPWSCTPRQRMCPSGLCPSELMGCWWLLPPGTPPTPCVWSWMEDVSSSWLT